MVNTDVVTFIDSDDWIEKDYLQNLMKAYSAYEGNVLITSDLTYCNQNGIIDKREKTLGKGNYDVRTEILPFYIWNVSKNQRVLYPSITGKIFKTDLVRKKIELVKETIRYGEDSLLLCHILMEIEKVVQLGELGYYYYQHETSATHEGGIDKIKALKIFLGEYLNILSSVIGKTEIRRQFGYVYKGDLLRFAGGEFNYVPIKHFFLPVALYGKNVVVYGAGKKGTEFVYENKNVTIKHWVDKAYASKDTKIPVENPENIRFYGKEEYDYILIAVEDRRIQRQIEKKLLEMGVDFDKIWPLEMKEFLEPVELTKEQT